MVTRSAWVASVLKAWEGEPCPKCGRDLRPETVDEEGVVWGWCERDELAFWVAREFFPDHFDPEPEADDLPF